MKLVFDSCIVKGVKKGISKKGNPYQFIEILDGSGGELSLKTDPNADLTDLAKLGLFPQKAEIEVKPEIQGFNLSLTVQTYKFARI